MRSRVARQIAIKAVDDLMIAGEYAEALPILRRLAQDSEEHILSSDDTLPRNGMAKPPVVRRRPKVSTQGNSYVGR